MSKKHYAERDIEEQKYYVDHISAMTGEKLHSKSDIAAELAHRDEEIEVLKTIAEDRALFINNAVELGYLNLPATKPDSAASIYKECQLVIDAAIRCRILDIRNR